VLNGIVNDRDEPVVSLHLISSKGHAHRHPVIIDTGFNGNLSVPEKLAKRYGWPYDGNRGVAPVTSEREPGGEYYADAFAGGGTNYLSSLND